MSDGKKLHKEFERVKDLGKIVVEIRHMDIGESVEESDDNGDRNSPEHVGIVSEKLLKARRSHTASGQSFLNSQVLKAMLMLKRFANPEDRTDHPIEVCTAECTEDSEVSVCHLVFKYRSYG